MGLVGPGHSLTRDPTGVGAGRGLQGHMWLPLSGFSHGNRSQHEGFKQGVRAPHHQGGAQGGVGQARGGLLPMSCQRTDGGCGRGQQNGDLGSCLVTAYPVLLPDLHLPARRGTGVQCS